MRLQRYAAVSLSSQAKFQVDDELVKRQIEAAEKLGPNSIKPLLIEDQPDTFVDTGFVSELPIG